jgi:tetratricopeptide (TPR) repeat protein
VKYSFLLLLCTASALSGQTKQSPQDLLKEAVTFQQQGKLPEAIHAYSQFLDMYPDAFQVRSNLGAALVGTGQYGQAIEQYKLALKAKPDNAVRLNLALAYYKSAEYVNAAQELDAIHQAEPENAKATMLLADCDLRRGENKAAVDLLTPLRQARPEDLGVAYLLGMALLRDGQTINGQVVIDQIMRQGDSAEVRLLMGTAKFSAKEFAPAVADFAKAVELNENLPDAWSYYGQALFATGDLAGSRKAFLKELEHDPNDFQANLHVGAMLRLDQNYAEALPYFQRAAAVRPNDTAIQYQIALVRLAEGKVEEARASLESIVKASPTFVEAHVSLATVYYREKRKQDGDHERLIVQQINAERQAQQPGAKQSDAEKIVR